MLNHIRALSYSRTQLYKYLYSKTSLFSRSSSHIFHIHDNFIIKPNFVHFSIRHQLVGTSDYVLSLVVRARPNKTRIWISIPQGDQMNGTLFKYIYICNCERVLQKGAQAKHTHTLQQRKLQTNKL